MEHALSSIRRICCEQLYFLEQPKTHNKKKKRKENKNKKGIYMRACRNMKPLFYVVKGDVWLLFYVHKAVRQRERKGEREREKKRWTLGFPASKKKNLLVVFS